MWVSLMPGYKKPIACGSTLLRLMHSRMQGRFYEEGSDIVHVPSFDAFHATCGCCCKHEFCCAVGCAAALARTVAQIRMMHVCLYLYIKRPDPATQAWGFLGETAARLACVSYVIRRRRCYNWFVVAAFDGCCSVAGAAGQCLISYGATCRWKGIACGGTRAGCYAGKLCCTRAHTWRYVWEIFCLSS